MRILTLAVFVTMLLTFPINALALDSCDDMLARMRQSTMQSGPMGRNEKSFKSTYGDPSLTCAQTEGGYKKLCWECITRGKKSYWVHVLFVNDSAVTVLLGCPCGSL